MQREKWKTDPADAHGAEFEILGVDGVGATQFIVARLEENSMRSYTRWSVA